MHCQPHLPSFLSSLFSETVFSFKSPSPLSILYSMLCLSTFIFPYNNNHSSTIHIFSLSGADLSFNFHSDQIRFFSSSSHLNTAMKILMVFQPPSYLICLLCFVSFVHGSSAKDQKPPLRGPATNVTKNLSFKNFNLNDLKVVQDLKLLGSAKFSNETFAIQIPDESQAIDLKHQAGRAIYSSPLRLFDPPTQTPASFQTTFSFQFKNGSRRNMSADDTTQSSSNYGPFGGSGFAFIIVPDEFTVGRSGKWLAMINDACDEDYKVVAVEFDTHQNPEFGDPSDNHVGINLGTIVSTKTFNASDVGIYLNDGSIHRAWISYDGPRKLMDIRIASETDIYPSKPLFSGPLDLSPFLKEYMFVGFSASTGNHTQIHSIFSWNFTSTSQSFLRVPSTETCESKLLVDSNESTKTEPSWTFLIFVAVVALALVILLSMYYNYKRRQDKKSEIVLPDKKQRPRPPNKPHRFTFSEISSATRGFNELEVLGSDWRGVYYRGKLSNGCQVAVKRFSAQFLSLNGKDRRRLLKEIRHISRIRHPNLVPVRGWCEENREIMAIYDFYPNGSLDKWLFGVGVLPWTRRFKVLKDVAEALRFLHSKQISHKNVKSSSVFLDVSFRALLGDYGLMLPGIESKRFESTVSEKVDVFEFGILVLEVVAGRKKKLELGDEAPEAEAESKEEEEEERDLVSHAWRAHEKNEKEKIVDRRMGSMINMEQAIRVMEIGLVCTLNENKGRPCMEEVIEFLSMEGLVPELPTTRPVCLYPYNSNTALCSGYTISCAAFN